jgi:hypothetical protein
MDMHAGKQFDRSPEELLASAYVELHSQLPTSIMLCHFMALRNIISRLKFYELSCATRLLI